MPVRRPITVDIANRLRYERRSAHDPVSRAGFKPFRTGSRWG